MVVKIEKEPSEHARRQRRPRRRAGAAALKERQQLALDLGALEQAVLRLLAAGADETQAVGDGPGGLDLLLVWGRGGWWGWGGFLKVFFFRF